VIPKTRTRFPWHAARAGALVPLVFATACCAQVLTLAPEFVSATRSPQPADQIAHTTMLLDAAALRAAPTLTLDEALRSMPAFSLFRRSDSLIANPTAQGVSLRGLGPSGASRTLVLLDGVPLNDPFGGWVAWTKVPREGLDRAEIVSGGGASAWGNAALGGVVQLFTTPAHAALRPSPISASASEATLPLPPTGSTPQLPGKPAWEAHGLGRIALTVGDFSTRSAEFALSQPIERGELQLLGRDFSTNGFALVAPERRGPIDVAAWSRHRWLTARWRQKLGASTSLTATARSYEEFRGNGTPFTRNGTREKFASLALAGAPVDGFSWSATAYAQDQSFASTFSSVNAARTAETPASDQFRVPAVALGAAWTGEWRHAAGRTTAGVDARGVHGETRENFSFVNGAFTRRRTAGGTQVTAGVFAVHERPLAPGLRATLGARLDDWREQNGRRRETDRASGASLRDDRYADRRDTGLSPSAGLVWSLPPAWRLRAAAQQSFRRPTLNELYRPFRQGSTIVEANAALRTERATSAEVGADFRRDALTLGASAFWNDFHDAVGNLTLARGPGTFPIFGPLPAGGVGRQRLNLDRTRVQGFEFSAIWRAGDALAFNAAALFNDATVRRAVVNPALVGKRIAQVPRRTVTLGATWHAPAGITVTPRLRWIGRQFEDDENALVLGETAIADLGASRPLGAHAELFLTIENIGNARLETSRSADGVVNTGTPRLALGGVRATW